jgi:alanyl-tRNA synthetase
MDSGATAAESVQNFFGTIVEDCVLQPARRGCLMLNSVAEFGGRDDRVVDLCRNTTEAMEGRVAARLQLAVNDGSMQAVLDRVGSTQFLGYEKNDCNATIKAILKDGEPVQFLEEGETGGIVLDRTPFYAEKGGQVGDTGVLTNEYSRARVTDTKEPEKGLTVHYVTVEQGKFYASEGVHAEIDVPRRERIRRNHTATHILHWALRQVLGEHVKQAGSLVAPDRLRFDFTHFEAMTRDQIKEVERIANEKIMENHPVTYRETSLKAAREAGVIALFGEKYGDIVRVLTVDGVSSELCGGTHVGRTSEIGLVKITRESSVGANQRRIEAVTSYDALG